MRGLFVTGTGTGVGKTIVSAALLAAMRAAGEPVRAYKPVITGLSEPPGQWPPDHELLALAAEMQPEEVSPLRFDPPVSPHLAAALTGQSIDPAAVIAGARAGSQGTLVVEGVGGLLVPIADRFSVRDLAVELGLPLVIAAAPGLGTINHTLLTVESARAVGLDVAAVVLTPWPSEPSQMEQSNRETIARLGAVEVATFAEIASGDIPALARAGDRLRWCDWLSQTSFVATRP
ncbi:MAG TPA: dethiobiotin synthase [Solirubrobacteraceae bacterium]|nr:dethiobiotin synthase [Solirubrobacteraceae bacterium]